MRNESAIIVLHYNKVKLTERCIRSVLDAGYPPQRIYCFDNGSQTQVRQEIQELFPRCKHRRIDDNLGFSGGFNRSMEWVLAEGGTSALFCTNDTLLEPGAVEACEATAARTGAGMVAPLLTYISRPENIDSNGAFFNRETGTIHHYHQNNLPEMLDPRKDYIPGTAVWIDGTTFHRLGGTDESFHMYWEDVDMCFRAHKEEIPLARCTGAVLRHGGGQTTRKKPLYTTFYFQRNRIRFCRRHLEGDQREKVLEKIRKELLEQASQWRRNNDSRRMEYLEKLLIEMNRG